MERLSIKKFYLDDYLCGTWMSVGIYGLLAILTFIAYKIGVINLKLIWDLGYKIIMSLGIVLDVSIVDIWSRESYVTKDARNFWNIATMIMTMIFLQFIGGVLFINEIIFFIVVSVIILLQTIYIFRNAENIKVN